jgi:hypothetical protein
MGNTLDVLLTAAVACALRMFDSPLDLSEGDEHQMRIVKLALAAVLAVLAFSAMAAGSASAVGHPLFETQSKAELLFSGLGGLALLRGSSIIDCEKTLIHGFASNKSTLAHKILLLFEGKCKNGSGVTCENDNGHITSKLLLGELGLLTSTNHKVVILLSPQEGTVNAKFTCGIITVEVEGAIVGDIPEINAKGVNQYNKQLSEIEEVFESEAKNTKQKITEIFLLGTQMPGPIHLTAFGAEASEEVKPNPVLKGDGTIEITTKE